MCDCTVSVGIVTYNQKELCANLVKGLIAYGPASMQIFITDNLPSLPVADYLGSLRSDSRIHVFNDETNPGYIVPSNRMAQACRSEFHVVTNDDIEVGPQWFEKLVVAFDDPQVAVAGPTPFFGYIDNHFNGQKIPPYGSLEYIEGWWMMLPRHILDKYGLFDEVNLKTATCEDSHLCLSLVEQGWKIKAVANLPVKHLDSMTKKSLDNLSWGFENRDYLVKRWATYLAEREKRQNHE